MRAVCGVGEGGRPAALKSLWPRSLVGRQGPFGVEDRGHLEKEAKPVQEAEAEAGHESAPRVVLFFFSCLPFAFCSNLQTLTVINRTEYASHCE